MAVPVLSEEVLRRAGLLHGCVEWLETDGMPHRCNAQAEFILWGKLFPPEALGPRCYDHAAKHVGSMLGHDSVAIADLRPLLRSLEEEPDPDSSPFDEPSYEAVEKGFDWIDRRVHGDDG